MPLYRVCGVGLWSDRGVPGLNSVAETGALRATIELGWGCFPADPGAVFADLLRRPTWYASPEQDELRAPNLRVWHLDTSKRYWFRYSDGIEFLATEDGSRIWARWEAPLTAEDAAIYLLGPVLGFALSQKDITCLHASAGVVDGQAVAFVGRGGTGKSTLAAALAQAGCPILADDMVALDDRNDTFYIQPAFPSVRLWPASVELLFGSPAALPRLVPTHPTWNKCALDLTQPGLCFADQSWPLTRIYLLDEHTVTDRLRLDAPAVTDFPDGGFPPRHRAEPRAGRERVPQAAVSTGAGRSTLGRTLHLESVPQIDAWLALVSHTYVNYLKGKSQLAREFDRLGRLARVVPMQRLVISRGQGGLNGLVATIRADLGHSVAGPSPFSIPPASMADVLS